MVARRTILKVGTSKMGVELFALREKPRDKLTVGEAVRENTKL